MTGATTPGPPPARATRRVRRAPALVVLAGLLVAAVVAGSGSGRAVRTLDGPREPVAMPPAEARSIAWYCAGGPVALRDTETGSELAAGDDVVVAGNLSDDDQPIRITVLADGEVVALARRTVPAHSSLRVPVRELTDAARPGVVVEAFSGDVAVEHVVRGSEAAAGPCATEASGLWYLPSGTTVVGTRQWLTLFNPFGDDAIVDVTFDTSSGRRQPGAYSGLVVPRRTRLTLPVHDAVFREEMVATTITARTGRLIAEQSIEVADDGTGTTLSLGAVAPAPTWVFAAGTGDEGVVRRIVVMNPGDVDIEVDVRALGVDDQIIEPLTAPVPRRSAVDIDVSSIATGPYGVVVDTGSARGVVVGDHTRWDAVALGPDVATGATTTLAAPRAATAWVLASARPLEQRRLRIAIANPDLEPATVTVEMHSAGGVEVSETAAAITVDPGRVAVATIRAPDDDGAVRIVADRPVVVDEIAAGGAGISVAAAIPPTPRIDPFDVSAATTTTTLPTPTTTTTTTAAPATTTEATTTTRPPRATTTEPERGGGSRRTTTTTEPSGATGGSTRRSTTTT